MNKKNENTQRKNDWTVQNIYYSRYLMLRYLLAFYFFCNLYWLFSFIRKANAAIIIPLALMVLAIPAVAEQSKKMSSKQAKVPKTKLYFQVQTSVNLCLSIICLTPLYSAFYPFMNGKYHLVFTAIALIGLLGCLIGLHRINKIEHNRDPYAKTIATYEKNN